MFNKIKIYLAIGLAKQVNMRNKKIVQIVYIMFFGTQFEQLGEIPSELSGSGLMASLKI